MPRYKDHQRPGNEQVGPIEFRKWLEQYNLTDPNAAKVFNVAPMTVKKWLKSGMLGSAAALFRTLKVLGIAPFHACDARNVDLSPFVRSQYERRAEEGVDRIEKARVIRAEAREFMGLPPIDPEPPVSNFPKQPGVKPRSPEEAINGPIGVIAEPDENE